jgi:hypothetical protein
MTLRRSPIRRKPRTDPVTSELFLRVIARDEGCVGFGLGADPCAGRLTLDHVQDGYGRMGKRAPSDMAHLVTLCWHHHLDGWATSHRPELRAYLLGFPGAHDAHVDPCPGCPPRVLA